MILRRWVWKGGKRGFESRWGHPGLWKKGGSLKEPPLRSLPMIIVPLSVLVLLWCEDQLPNQELPQDLPCLGNVLAEELPPIVQVASQFFPDLLQACCPKPVSCC